MSKMSNINDFNSFINESKKNKINEFIPRRKFYHFFEIERSKREDQDLNLKIANENYIKYMESLNKKYVRFKAGQHGELGLVEGYVNKVYVDDVYLTTYISLDRKELQTQKDLWFVKNPPNKSEVYLRFEVYKDYPISVYERKPFLNISEEDPYGEEDWDELIEESQNNNIINIGDIYKECGDDRIKTVEKLKKLTIGKIVNIIDKDSKKMIDMGTCNFYVYDYTVLQKHDIFVARLHKSKDDWGFPLYLSDTLIIKVPEIKITKEDPYGEEDWEETNEKIF